MASFLEQLDAIEVAPKQPSGGGFLSKLDAITAQPETFEELRTKYPDKGEGWIRSQMDTVKEGMNAGLPAFRTDQGDSVSRLQLKDAITRVEKAGFKVPHFIGKDGEPEGDRAPTMDTEGLIIGLQQQEGALREAGKIAEAEKVQKERNYWSQNLQKFGMSAQQWKQQTGEDDPVYPSQYETQLPPEKEKEFGAWKKKYAPNDSGDDYDFRGAFAAGVKPAANGHWPDTFKKPNHPTFSKESVYATGENAAKAGSWNGDTFVPPKPYNPEQQSLISLGQQYIGQQQAQGKPVAPNLTPEKLLSIGEGIQNLQTAQKGAQQAQENPSWQDVYAGQAAAGAVDFEQGLRILGAALDDDLLNDENLGTIAQQEEVKVNFPQTEGMKKLAQSTGFLDTASALLGDIPGTLGPTFTRSLVQGAAPMAGGAAIGAATASVPGALVGTGVGAGVADAVQSFGDYLRQKNVNLADPTAIRTALQDPEIKKEALKYAGIRGLIIGATSALGGGVAGRVASLPAKNLIGRGAAITGDVALQSGIEGGGEAAAQLATTGKINPADVAAEAIVGLPLNAAETTVGGIYQSRQQKPVQVENLPKMKPVELRPDGDPQVAATEAEILAKSEAMVKPASTVDAFLSGEELPTTPIRTQSSAESFAPPALPEKQTTSAENLGTINQPEEQNAQQDTQATKVYSDVQQPEGAQESQGEMSVAQSGQGIPQTQEVTSQNQATIQAIRDRVSGPEAGAIDLAPVLEAIDTVRQQVPGRLRAGETYDYGTIPRTAWSVVIEKGQLPTDLREVYERMQNRISATRHKFTLLAGDVKRAVNKLHKSKVDREAEFGRIQNAMVQEAGMDISALDPKLQKSVWALRNAIDTLSTYAVNENIVEGPLADSFRDGIGNYLRRGYAVFDPESGWNYKYLQKNEPTIISDAEAYLKSTDPTLTDDAARAIVKELLDRDQAASWMMGGKSTLGKSTGSLMQRKEIAEPIRKLLGEITDPLVNSLRSGDFLTQLTVRHEMQQEFRDVLLRNGWAETAQSGKAPVELVEDTWVRAVDSDGKEVFNRRSNKRHDVLRGLWTTPEFKAAFEELEQFGNPGAARHVFDMLARGYLGVSALAKVSATLFNPDSYAPNYIGALLVEAANGRLRPSTWGDAWQALTAGKSEKETIGAAKKAGIKNARQLYGELLRRGVIDQNITFRDFEATLNNSFLKKYAPTKLYQGTLKATGKIFSSGDNLGKANAFIDELETLRKAYPTRPQEELLDEAAEITRNTTLSYDTVPKGLRDLSQAGFFLQNFLNFTYSTIRSVAYSAAQGTKELASSNPTIKMRGARRMAALGIVLSASSYWGLSALSRSLTGVDDEEDEAFRRSFAPPWDRDANLVYGKVDGGNYTYSNQSYITPQSILLEAVTAAKEGKNPEEVAKNTMNVFVGNFIQEGILASALLDVTRNRRGDTGQPVYNEEISTLQKTGKITEHIWNKALQPKILAKADRTVKALTGETGYGGTTYSVGNEVARLAGYRARTVDIHKSLPFRLFAMNDRWREAERIEQQAENRSLTGAKLESAIAQGKDAKARVLKDYGQLLKDAETLGIDRAEIMQAMKDTRTQLEVRVDLGYATAKDRQNRIKADKKKASEKAKEQ